MIDLLSHSIHKVFLPLILFFLLSFGFVRVSFFCGFICLIFFSFQALILFFALIFLVFFEQCSFFHSISFPFLNYLTLPPLWFALDSIFLGFLAFLAFQDFDLIYLAFLICVLIPFQVLICFFLDVLLFSYFPSLPIYGFC